MWLETLAGVALAWGVIRVFRWVEAWWFLLVVER